MTRKPAPTQTALPPNRQPSFGDAHEPGQPSDARFDLADLEPTSEVSSNNTAEPTNGTAPSGPDPFDPAALRLSEDHAANLGVKKALLTVPVRKPDKSWWVRVHPDEKYRL